MSGMSTSQTEGGMQTVWVPMSAPAPQRLFSSQMMRPQKQVGRVTRTVGVVLYSIYLVEWIVLFVAYIIFHSFIIPLNESNKRKKDAVHDERNDANYVASSYFLFSLLWIILQLYGFAYVLPKPPVLTMTLTGLSLALAIIFMGINLYVNVATEWPGKADVDHLSINTLMFLNLRWWSITLGWIHFIWLTILAAVSTLHLINLLKWSLQRSETNLGDTPQIQQQNLEQLPDLYY